MKKILPYIAIVATGAFAGNMINIGLSYCVHWQSLDPIAFMESFKIDFPLLLGPTAATLLPAFIATLWLFFSKKKTNQQDVIGCLLLSHCYSSISKPQPIISQ